MITTIDGSLAALVATGGTFNVNYPTGKGKGNFAHGQKVKLAVGNVRFSCPDDFTVAYNAGNMTVTYNGAASLAAGSLFFLQLDEKSAGMFAADPAVGGFVFSKPMTLCAINLGAPAAASANAIQTTAALTAAAGAVAPTGGALVSGGVANLATLTGRNVVAAWTNAAILTVNGLDIYGKPMSEKSAAGVAFTGKKAFAKITSIQVSADVTGLTIGTGNVLGLPIYLPNAAMILKESMDNAAAAAGTVVAGLDNATKSTQTGGDIRGTYAPNSAPNGARVYELLIATDDPTLPGISTQS